MTDMEKTFEKQATDKRLLFTHSFTGQFIWQCLLCTKRLSWAQDTLNDKIPALWVLAFSWVGEGEARKEETCPKSDDSHRK